MRIRVYEHEETCNKYVILLIRKWYVIMGIITEFKQSACDMQILEKVYNLSTIEIFLKGLGS